MRGALWEQKVRKEVSFTFQHHQKMKLKWWLERCNTRRDAKYSWVRNTHVPLEPQLWRARRVDSIARVHKERMTCWVFSFGSFTVRMGRGREASKTGTLLEKCLTFWLWCITKQDFCQCKSIITLSAVSCAFYFRKKHRIPRLRATWEVDEPGEGAVDLSGLAAGADEGSRQTGKSHEDLQRGYRGRIRVAPTANTSLKPPGVKSAVRTSVWSTGLAQHLELHGVCAALVKDPQQRTGLHPSFPGAGVAASWEVAGVFHQREVGTPVRGQVPNGGGVGDVLLDLHPQADRLDNRLVGQLQFQVNAGVLCPGVVVVIEGVFDVLRLGVGGSHSVVLARLSPGQTGRNQKRDCHSLAMETGKTHKMSWGKSV